MSRVGLRPETLFAMAEARAWCEKHGHEFVVTSCTEGRHGRSSRHYAGLAFDMRTRHMTPAQKTACVRALRKKLGEDYDVVREKTHFHLEYDPK